VNIFSFLFQPDKSKLSPAGRAFIAWLEIVLISIPSTGAIVGLDYLNGHPGDYQGMVPFIVSAMVLALLKALTTLGVSMKNTSVSLPDAPPAVPPAPQPPVIIHNNMPALPQPQIIQTPAPAPPVQLSISAADVGKAIATQFKSPMPAVPDITTNAMPAIPMTANGRDWTGLEIPAVQP
jgi:hypothetical protein